MMKKKIHLINNIKNKFLVLTNTFCKRTRKHGLFFIFYLHLQNIIPFQLTWLSFSTTPLHNSYIHGCKLRDMTKTENIGSFICFPAVRVILQESNIYRRAKGLIQLHSCM